MAYVEILRIRNAFCWFAGILVVAAVSMLVGINTHTGELSQGSHSDNGALGLSGLLGLAVYCAMVLATVLGISLNRENDGVEMVFTKPVARVRLALTYFVCDLAAIFVACIFATLLFAGLVLDVGAVARAPHAVLALDSASVEILLLGTGVAFMWYGLLQAATSWQVGKGGLYVGLSWALFFVLLGLSHVPSAWFHSAMVAINFINPLAYMSELKGSTIHGVASLGTASIFGASVWARVAIVWGIGIAGCALGAFGWKRLEV